MCVHVQAHVCVWVCRETWMVQAAPVSDKKWEKKKKKKNQFLLKAWNFLYQLPYSHVLSRQDKIKSDMKGIVGLLWLWWGHVCVSVRNRENHCIQSDNSFCHDWTNSLFYVWGNSLLHRIPFLYFLMLIRIRFRVRLSIIKY